jgi:hypothetical protein
MADYIHGGTDLRKVARLTKQAMVWVAPRMLGDFTAEIFESLDEALGPKETPHLQAGARSARALCHLPGAEFLFRPVAALARR